MRTLREHRKRPKLRARTFSVTQAVFRPAHKTPHHWKGKKRLEDRLVGQEKSKRKVSEQKEIQIPQTLVAMAEGGRIGRAQEKSQPERKKRDLGANPQAYSGINKGGRR